MSYSQDKNDKVKAFLQKKNFPYQKLFEIHSDAIYLIDNLGYLIEYNQGFSRLTGYIKGEMIGERFHSIIHPDDIERMAKNFRESIGGKPKRREFRIIHKDGTIKFIYTDAVPFHSEDGEILGLFIIGKDITKQKKLELTIQQQDKKFSSLIQHSTDVIILLDKNQSIIYRSTSYEALFGYKGDELSSNPFSKMHPDDKKPIQDLLNNLYQKNGESKNAEFRLKHKNGQWQHVQAKGKNLLDDPHVNAVVVNFRDISDMKMIQQEINFMAYHDYLTELPNRRSLEEKLEAELEYVKSQNKKLALIFVDIDNFKFINDNLGHDAGDTLLKKVAKTLQSSVGHEHFIARWSGDEFIILLSDIVNETPVKDLAKKLKESFCEPFIYQKYELFITISMGISIYPDSGEDPKLLLKNADLAMYSIKGSGKNDYQLFSQTMGKNNYQTFLLKNDLQKALLNNQFELYFQRKVNMNLLNVVGAEALIRWNHPEWGIITPNEFIPLAEESELILSLGEWVLNNVCRQIKQWEEEGLEPINISINFSAKQFLQKDLVEMISNSLNEKNVDGKWIEIEITESIFLEKEMDITNVIEEIKQLGIQIALDDFGTGYSSLSYLRKYKFNTIKLDKSFIRDIHANEESAAIVKFIVDLGKQLKTKIVAEGVELEEQLAVLQKLKCEEVQGYFFSKPMPINEFEKVWIK